MNNIVSFIVVILLIFNIAMAFFVAAIIDRIEKVTEKISGIRNDLTSINSAMAELDIAATLAKQAGDESLKQSRNAINMSKEAIKISGEAHDQSTTALERATKTHNTVDGFTKSMIKYTTGTFGTTDPGEFSRVKTKAYNAESKTKELENAVRVLYHRVGANYPSGNSQNGIIGIRVADDVRAMGMQRRKPNA